MGAFGLKWRGAFAKSTRDAPYEREIRYDIVNGGYVFGGGGGLGNRLRFSELTDEVASAGVDATYKFPIGENRDAELSAGAYYANTVRDSQLYQFAWTGPRGPTPLNVLTARVVLADVEAGLGGAQVAHQPSHGISAASIVRASAGMRHVVAQFAVGA